MSHPASRTRGWILISRNHFPSERRSAVFSVGSSAGAQWSERRKPLLRLLGLGLLLAVMVARGLVLWVAAGAWPLGKAEPRAGPRLSCVQ
jgi:hypothetical protein